MIIRAQNLYSETSLSKKMASIPCAAYQASHIHGNIRKQTQCRSRNSSGESNASSPPLSPIQRQKSLTETFVNNVIAPFRKSSWPWSVQNGTPQSSMTSRSENGSKGSE